MSIVSTAKESDVRAARAFDGTSWSPEQREERTVSDYMNHIAEVYATFAPFETAENSGDLAEDLDEYRQRYAQMLNAYLAAHSRVVSQFITGAGGWTAAKVRSAEKKNDTVDKRRSELVEWSSKRQDRLRQRYDPKIIARAPISSTDPRAIERLQEKVDALERFQELMREANKIVRMKISAEERILRLQEIPGISEANATKLVMQPDWSGKPGFPAYALTNNSAKIRSAKERIAELEAKAARYANVEELIVHDYDGIQMIENVDEQRVQLVFPRRTSKETYDTLRRHGFVWSRTNEAFQRQLNVQSIEAARQVLATVQAKGGDY